MSFRFLLPHRLALAMIAGFGFALGAASAHAQVGTQAMCVADLDGDGTASGPGETALCEPARGGSVLCPLQKVACVIDDAGTWSCPLGGQHQCLTSLAGGTPSCSPNACADPNAAGTIVDDPSPDDPGVPADGPVDAAGNCTGTIEIFSGRAVRCRPPGLKTTFQNCCKDKGEIVKDGTGSSVVSISGKIAVAKGVFTGMQAAFNAFRAGQTAAQAASAGAHALIVGIDPTSLAISVAINFMIEVLLQGCDSQDMETGMLRGSGMCHEVGSYCSSRFLGICLQKSRGHCCFNTKLGRIIQEQGRPQLKSFAGIGWGTPKNPICRGFTADEFQALDFSRMDLSEYYSEVQARAQSDIETNMRTRADAYLKTMGK